MSTALVQGYPIGATGGLFGPTCCSSEVAGDIQVPGAEIGLVHNVGGVGIYGNVVILGGKIMGFENLE